jgi:hypothetical protein
VLDIRSRATARRIGVTALVCCAFPLATAATAAAGYVDDGDPAVVYGGKWNTYANSDTYQYFGGTGRISLAETPHASVTVSWTGRRAQVIASTEHNNQVHGLANVTVDGDDRGEISYSTPTKQSKKMIFDTGVLPYGDHTIVITALGTAGEYGTGIRISFDALVFGACLGANALNACDKSVGLVGDDLSDADFFAALDLTRPGLADVRTAVDAGDYASAKSELAAYFRAQPQRAQTLEGQHRPAPVAGYNTLFADDIGDSKTYAGGKPTGSWYTGRLPHWYEMANAYWWTGRSAYSRTIGDWLGTLVRQRELRSINNLLSSLGSHPFTHAFWALQDAAYADFSVEQRIGALKEILAFGRDLVWRLDTPDPGLTAPNMYTIAGTALTKLGYTFPEFAESGTWVSKGMTEVRRTVAEDLFEDGTGVEMSTGYSAGPLGTAYGVYDLTERLGLAPPTGLDTARLTAGGWYWAYLLHPDGAQPALGDGDGNSISEQALGGGTTYVDGGSQTFGGSMPANYAAVLASAPAGWYTRGLSRVDLVRGVAAIVGEPGMAAAVDGGPPSLLPESSRAFETTAQYVMRSGFDGAARYLVFDAGPRGQSSHGHQDKLSFDMYAYGKSLIADPGRFVYYSGSNPEYTARWSAWFKRTSAHNTLVVDDKLQNTGVPDMPPLPAGQSTWASDPTFFDATGAYAGTYGFRPVGIPTVAATHKREVFFVQPTYWIVTDRMSGPASAKVTSMFHFTPGTAATDATTKKVTFVTADGSAGAVLAPAGTAWGSVTVASGTGGEMPTSDSDADLLAVRGWYAPVYGAKQAAPQANYTHTGSLPAAFATVIYPFAGATAPSVATTTMAVTHTDGSPAAGGEAVAVRVTRPGGADVFLSAPADGVDRTFGTGRTDGKRLFVARATGGQVQRIVLLRGAFARLDGVDLIESPSRLEQLSATCAGDTVALRGEGLQNGLRIAAPPTITKVTVNGTAVAAHREGEQLVLGA